MWRRPMGDVLFIGSANAFILHRVFFLLPESRDGILRLFDNFKFHQNQKTKQLRVCFFVLYTVYTYKRQALKIKEARGLEYQRNWFFFYKFQRAETPGFVLSPSVIMFIFLKGLKIKKKHRLLVCSSLTFKRLIFEDLKCKQLGR